QSYLRALLGTIAFTSLFNTAGNPAMSVPLYWSGDGLPIGAQFAAGFGGEATLFRLAVQPEAAQPRAGRRPPRPRSVRAPIHTRVQRISCNNSLRMSALSVRTIRRVRLRRRPTRTSGAGPRWAKAATSLRSTSPRRSRARYANASRI